MGNVRGEKVWDFNTMAELIPEANDIVIILTIKNVFEHTDIAYKLAEMGFDQCVYKPLPILKGYSDEKLEKISMVYDTILGDLIFPKEQILAKVKLNYKMYYKDCFMISQNTDKEVLAWMPLELIFNYKKADAYENISMAIFFPLVNLYKLFIGNKNRKEKDVLNDFYNYASEWAYRNQVQITEELKASWVESRWKSFANMQEISDYKFDFFMKNAPWVEAGDKGKFYMVHGGRNRVVFLAAKGYRHIPVRLKLDHYEHWLNKETFLLLQEYMEKEHIVKTVVPVPHPYFKDMRADNVDYYRLVLFPIAEYLIYNSFFQAKIKVNGYDLTDREGLKQIKDYYSILCDLEDEGACSRYLDACGFKVNRIKRSNNVFTTFLDKLFYQEINEVTEQDCPDCRVLIFDHDFREKELVENGEIECIICIDVKENIMDYLERCGFRFVCILNEFYCKNRSKKVQVYIKERLV